MFRQYACRVHWLVWLGGWNHPADPSHKLRVTCSNLLSQLSGFLDPEIELFRGGLLFISVVERVHAPKILGSVFISVLFVCFFMMMLTKGLFTFRFLVRDAQGSESFPVHLP